MRRAALAGLGPARLNLGLFYRDGRGVPQDYQRALEWFLLAAAAGVADAPSAAEALQARMSPAQITAAQAAATSRGGGIPVSADSKNP